ncbi:MAG: response regulator [Burkholderiales bacterium]|nr:response regulator [Burkholderiales bacterium]
MKGFWNTRMHVSLGLCGMTLSVLLAAAFFGLIPDREGAQREARAALAEVTAAASTALLTAGDLDAIKAMLKLVVERNEGLLSAAVRRADGTLMVVVGSHEPHWEMQLTGRSTETQVQVPILAGARRWGQMELRFRALAGVGIGGLLRHPWVLLLGSVFAAGFVAYYFYLGRVLRQLDPSQAVPARVRSALDTLAEGLLILDRRQQIVLANNAFAAVAGKDAERLVGRHVRELAWRTPEGEPLAASAQPWRQTLHDGAARTHVLLRLAAAQPASERIFIVNCAPIAGSGARPNGVLVSLDDVTQLEEKKVELARARDEAESANRAKSAFLANMSHEIRTPMNAILGFTELLRRGHGKGGPDAQKYLGTIHSSGKHLLELINDILDLSKVESGRFELERVRCAPHRIAQDVIDVLGVRAREKGVELAFEPLGMLPEAIESDPARLRQILTNLVGNAIKFTERGSVRVRLRLVEARALPELEIAVIDQGIGIAQDKLEEIFEPFVQADASVSRRFGGTGLGLAISRRFARALGGDIVASSVAGEGSTFTMRIPAGPLAGVALIDARAASRDAAGATPDAASASWRFPPCRVLVVDDGPENRELVRLVLEEAGIEVEEAGDGLAGVTRTLDGRFDAVLMDVQMPRLDGVAATRQLREHGCRLPIVALTAHAMKGYEEDMRAHGFTACLVKPIDIDGMLAALAEILGGERVAALADGAHGDAHAPVVSTAAAPVSFAAAALSVSGAAEAAPVPGAAEAAPVVPVAAEPAPVPVAAAESLVSRYADKPRLHGAIRQFGERLTLHLDQLEGAAAGADFETIGKLAHSIKGSGGTVGFDAFTTPAAELEAAARSGDVPRIEALIGELRALERRMVLPAGESVRAAA